MAKTAAEVLFLRLWKQLQYTTTEFDLDSYSVLGVLELLKAHIIWPEDFQEDPDNEEEADEEDSAPGD